MSFDPGIGDEWRPGTPKRSPKPKATDCGSIAQMLDDMADDLDGEDHGSYTRDDQMEIGGRATGLRIAADAVRDMAAKHTESGSVTPGELKFWEDMARKMAAQARSDGPPGDQRDEWWAGWFKAAREALGSAAPSPSAVATRDDLAALAMAAKALRDYAPSIESTSAVIATALDGLAAKLRAMECRSIDLEEIRDLARELRNAAAIGEAGGRGVIAALSRLDSIAFQATEQESIADDSDLIDEDPVPPDYIRFTAGRCRHLDGATRLHERDAWAIHHGWPELARHTEEKSNG